MHLHVSNEQMPSMNEVIRGRLYLGNVYAFEDDMLFITNGIDRIVNCTSNPTSPGIIKKFGSENCVHYNLDDNLNEFIFEFFTKFENFMKESNKKKMTVFIHCHAGISRSSTLVISYLMKLNHKKRDGMIKFLKRCRPIIQPNKSFMKQLNIWECELGLNKKYTKQSIENKKKNMKIIAKKLHENDLQKHLY